MKRISRHHAAAFILVVLSCLLSSCAFIKPSSGKMEAETWLPADTVALFSIPDVQTAKEKWKKTAAGEAWSAPELDYYLSQQLYPVMDALCKKTDMQNGRQILNLIDGEAVLAVELPGDGGDSARKPVFYAIASFGKNSDQAKKLIDKNMPKNKASEGKVHAQYEWIGDSLVVASSGTKLKDLQDRRKAYRAKFFGKQKRESLPGLVSNETWRKMQEHALRNSDGIFFLDIGRIYDVTNPMLQEALTKKNKGVQLIALNLFLKTAGLDDIDAVLSSVQMRDKAFYTRSAVAYQDGATGILVPPKNPKPLQTPNWITKDVEAFTATSIHPPAEMKAIFQQTLKSEYPFLETIITTMIEAQEKKLGVDIDPMLGAFGSEIAFFSDSSASGPIKAVVLWEVQDKNALENIFKTIQTKWKGTVEQRSFAGYTYEERKFGSFPLPIYTAQIGNFLMIAAQDQWIKNFVTQKCAVDKAKASGKELDVNMPAGPDSILPVLDDPFADPPKGYVVTGRAYQDPAPALKQIGGLAPLSIPLINLQLKRQNMPTIPTWVMQTFPPFMPFANAAFPMVGRMMQKDQDVVIQESKSAFHPAVSPFTAMAAVIAGHYMTDTKGK